MADGTLVATPGDEPDESLIASLLTLSDVMGTGHHAARRRRGRAGLHRRRGRRRRGRASAACSPPSAWAPSGSSRCRATPTGRRWPRDFGATDVVAERGDDGVGRGPGAARRHRRRRRAGVRGHQGVDAAGDRRRPGPAAGSATSACRPAAPSCRSASCSPATSRSAAASRRSAATSPSCSTTCSGRDRPGPGVRPGAPAGAGARGLRRDGRAPLDQDDAPAVAAAAGPQPASWRFSAASTERATASASSPRTTARPGEHLLADARHGHREHGEGDLAGPGRDHRRRLAIR